MLDFWGVSFDTQIFNHQKFQVPKMEEFWTIFQAILGVRVFPFMSRIHTVYIGEDSSILGAWNVWWLNLAWEARPLFGLINGG